MTPKRCPRLTLPKLQVALLSQEGLAREGLPGSQSQTELTHRARECVSENQSHSAEAAIPLQAFADQVTRRFCRSVQMAVLH